MIQVVDWRPFTWCSWGLSLCCADMMLPQLWLLLARIWLFFKFSDLKPKLAASWLTLQSLRKCSVFAVAYQLVVYVNLKVVHFAITAGPAITQDNWQIWQVKAGSYTLVIVSTLMYQDWCTKQAYAPQRSRLITTWVQPAAADAKPNQSMQFGSVYQMILYAQTPGLTCPGLILLALNLDRFLALFGLIKPAR